MQRFDKLVRDRIPDIVARNGERAVTRTLSTDEYRYALVQKLAEEVAEVQSAAGDAEALAKEIGDVQEVLAYLIRAYELDPDAITRLQRERHEQRGGFKDRIYLEYTE